ncbi:metallophosphoesterase family protein [Paraburkholderia megapolitana]|uniref:metallophosphoesterase family protein n=1 Tax=Paraburkholderia megapolitana TaxID=420953 RepID=UPI0038BC2FEA
MHWLSKYALPVVSDIHGNADGYSQILFALKAHGITQPPLLLGDLFWTGIEERRPREVLEMVMSMPYFGIVKGNTEHYISSGWLDAWEPDSDEDKREKRAMQIFRKSLSAAEYQFIRDLPEALPFEYADRACLAVHASPADIERGMIVNSSDENWRSLLNGSKADILITGHLHRAFTHIANGITHICVGAAGRHPRDEDGILDYTVLDKTAVGLAAMHMRLMQA